MAIESIMSMGIGFLFAGLIAVVVMPLVHGRAERLSVRRLEAALPQSMAEIQADKDLLRAEFAMSTRRLEIIVEQLRTKSASQLVELGKKQDAVNRLNIERDALNIEVLALKTQVEAAARSTKIAEQASLVPVEDRSMQADTWTRDKRISDTSGLPTFSSIHEAMWARDESAGQSTQTDTWTRDARINGTSVVPTIERFNQDDTWTREEPTSDTPIGPTIRQPIQKDTWERTGEHPRDESESAQVFTWHAPMSAFGVTADSRARRSA